jgi:hypothetical protein
MHEEVEVTPGSGLDGRGDQYNSASLEFCPGSSNVIDVQSNVMHPGAPLA